MDQSERFLLKKLLQKPSESRDQQGKCWRQISGQFPTHFSDDELYAKRLFLEISFIWKRGASFSQRYFDSLDF